MPGKGDASMCGLVEPADAVEHRGLASTIGPDQAMNGPFLDLKRDIVNGFESTKVHGEMLDRKMRHSSFLDVPRVWHRQAPGMPRADQRYLSSSSHFF